MERYCIRCGRPTVKQNDSLYVCEAGHQNWINPAVGAVVFVLKDDTVLYGVRDRDPGKGLLDAPGGFIEVGETAEQAAIREAKEEVGLDVTLLDCLGTYATTYQGRPILNIVYIASCGDQIAVPGDDMSGGELVWRGVSDLLGPSEAAFEWYEPAQADLLAWWHQNRP